mmetsp:Transcript_6507/g.16553  ORF Transcript_6507/g.16553 Transcript_6507/m.16553 type:complete len:204 (-) Transcript_6507:258-869(-)
MLPHGYIGLLMLFPASHPDGIFFAICCFFFFFFFATKTLLVWGPRRFILFCSFSFLCIFLFYTSLLDWVQDAQTQRTHARMRKNTGVSDASKDKEGRNREATRKRRRSERTNERMNLLHPPHQHPRDLVSERTETKTKHVVFVFFFFVAVHFFFSFLFFARVPSPRPVALMPGKQAWGGVGMGLAIPHAGVLSPASSCTSTPR